MRRSFRARIAFLSCFLLLFGVLSLFSQQDGVFPDGFLPKSGTAAPDPKPEAHWGVTSTAAEALDGTTLIDQLQEHDPQSHQGTSPGNVAETPAPDSGETLSPATSPLEIPLTPEEKLSMAEYKVHLFSEARRRLEQTLAETRKALASNLKVSEEIGPDSPETSALLHLFLRIGNRLNRLTCSLLSAMFCGNVGPVEASGLLLGLDEGGRPRHVYFDVADLRLEIDFLQRKIVRLTKVGEAFSQEAAGLRSDLPVKAPPGPGKDGTEGGKRSPEDTSREATGPERTGTQ